MAGEGPGASREAARTGPRSAAALLRATAVDSLLRGLLFSIFAGAGCLLPLAQLWARRTFEGHLRAAGVPTRRSSLGVVVVLSAHVGYMAAGLAGLALVQVLREPDAGAVPLLEALGFGATTLGLTIALRPFVFLPFVLADGRAAVPLGDALARAVELGARAGRPFWRRFDAVFVPAFVVAPLALFADVPLGAALAALGWGTGLVVASALVTARYAVLSPRGFETLPDPARHTPRALRVVGASALVASLLAGAALAAALVIPTPARPPDEGVAQLRSAASAVTVLREGERLRLPGSRVEVWVESDALYVEARDGGGAGRIGLASPPLSAPPDDFGAPVLTVLTESDGAYRLVASRPRGGSQAVRIDGEGVRLDDGLRRRAGLRLGQLGALALLALLAAWLVFLLRSQRQLATARMLRAIRDASELGDDARSLAALDGQLEATSLVVEDRRARFDAPAHVVRGALRVRLPAEVPLLAEGELAHGSRVTLVGRFSRLGGRNLREAALPSPADAALVAGGRDEAHRILVSAAARGGTVALTVALVAALVLVGRVLFGLA